MRSRICVCTVILSLISMVTFTNAAVTITLPGNGVNISADTAANGSSPSYTTLNTISIVEGLISDLAALQTNKTLVLTPPANWEFNPGQGTLGLPWLTDITSSSLDVTSGSITITLSTLGVLFSDSLALNNIQIRPTNGRVLPSSGSIIRAWGNPGTLNILGILNDVTSLGVLSITTGAYNKLNIVLPGQTFVAGSGVSWTPTNQTAGVAFNVSLVATDQFFNVLPSISGALNLTFSGIGGTPILPNVANMLTGLSNGTISMTLKKAETTTINLTDGLVNTVSSALTVLPNTNTQLQILVPGQTNAPGTITGVVGSALNATGGVAFTATVLATDAYFNLVPTTDVINVVSSDPYATITNTGSLISGQKNVSVTLLSAGTSNLTTLNLTNVWITSGLSSIINVNNLVNLYIGKTANTGYVASGQIVVYTITYGNTGAVSLATNVLIQDTLPNSISLVSIPSGFSLSGNILSWLLATLFPGSGGTIIVTGIGNANITSGQSIINNVSISSSITDILPGNNSGSVVITGIINGTGGGWGWGGGWGGWGWGGGGSLPSPKTISGIRLLDATGFVVPETGLVEFSDEWLCYSAVNLKDAYIKDAIEDTELKNALRFAYRYDLTRYTNIKDFRPYDYLTREEASKMFMKLAMLLCKKQLLRDDPKYSDLSKADATLQDFIGRCRTICCCICRYTYSITGRRDSNCSIYTVFYWKEKKQNNIYGKISEKLFHTYTKQFKLHDNVIL